MEHFEPRERKQIRPEKPIPRYLFGFLSTIPMDQEVPGNETMKHSGIIEHSWLENGPGWGVDGIFQKKHGDIPAIAMWSVVYQRVEVSSEKFTAPFLRWTFFGEWPRSLTAKALTTNGWLKDDPFPKGARQEEFQWRAVKLLGNYIHEIMIFHQPCLLHRFLRCSLTGN